MLRAVVTALAFAAQAMGGDWPDSEDEWGVLVSWETDPTYGLIVQAHLSYPAVQVCPL